MKLIILALLLLTPCQTVDYQQPPAPVIARCYDGAGQVVGYETVKRGHVMWSRDGVNWTMIRPN